MKGVDLSIKSVDVSSSLHGADTWAVVIGTHPLSPLTGAVSRGVHTHTHTQSHRHFLVDVLVIASLYVNVLGIFSRLHLHKPKRTRLHNCGDKTLQICE